MLASPVRLLVFSLVALVAPLTLQAQLTGAGGAGTTGTTGAATGGGSIGAATATGAGGAMTAEAAFSGVERGETVGSTGNTGSGFSNLSVAAPGGGVGAAGGLGGFRSLGGGGLGGLGGLGSLFGGLNSQQQTAKPAIRTRLRSAVLHEPHPPERVERRASQRFQALSQPALQGVRVTMEGRKGIITGVVESERQQRMSEMLLRLEPGVNEIDNQVRIGRP